MNEKYGPEFGFQLGLRQKESKVVVKYGMPVRAKEHDPALTAINIDDLPETIDCVLEEHGRGIAYS